MEDLIRRSDAIKAMQECFQVLARQRVQAVKMIEAIHSADNEIIGKLKTAIENEKICKNCPTAKRISGENLLGAMALGFSYGMDVDRPQGKWIRISSLYSLDRTYRCSVCGKVIDDMPMDEYYDPAYKGCPYCLARMKGADDE